MEANADKDMLNKVAIAIHIAKFNTTMVTL